MCYVLIKQFLETIWGRGQQVGMRVILSGHERVSWATVNILHLVCEIGSRFHKCPKIIELCLGYRHYIVTQTLRGLVVLVERDKKHC